MRSHWIFIFSILIFRFSLGLVSLANFHEYDHIRVTGNINNIYQNDSECIMVVGRFWIDSRSPCTYHLGTKIQVVGRVRGGVIDRLLGRLWLTSAELLVMDNMTKVNSTLLDFNGVFSRIAEYSANKYRRFVPEPESSLIAGIVLGYKKDIGQKLYGQMVKSGTIHIAVASGYNIMLVGGTVLSVCFWLMKRKPASIVAILVMMFYAIEAGGEPPVVRAVIMASAVFLAAVMGRKAVSWWILIVTGWLMVLIEPLLLVNVSFQLSMAASVGLMAIEPAISNYLSKRAEKLSEILSGSGLLTSISTMIITAPIIWWHFGRMSWIGILSNILILPLVPILMIVGAGMQVLPQVFSWPTYVIAHWMVAVIGFFGR